MARLSPALSLVGVFFVGAALAALLLAACPTVVPVPTGCEGPEDCPSGVCVDGTCVDVDAGTAGEGEGEGEGDGGEGEGEGEGDGGEGEGEGEGEPPPFVATCKALHLAAPGLPSGNYDIDLNDNGQHDDGAGVFCEMERGGGGWTTIGFLSQTTFATPGFACPGQWTFVDNGAFKGCKRDDNVGGGQASATARALHPYSEVMGHIEVIAKGDPEAFLPSGVGIDEVYVDGVSVTTEPTTGRPRQHIMTLAAAHPTDADNGPTACPCRGGSAAPAFVGLDSFCEKGSAASSSSFDANDPLWDSAADMLCTPADLDPTLVPFFVRSVAGSPRSDKIEIRLMADESAVDEDLVLTRLELYIR